MNESEVHEVLDWACAALGVTGWDIELTMQPEPPAFLAALQGPGRATAGAGEHALPGQRRAEVWLSTSPARMADSFESRIVQVVLSLALAGRETPADGHSYSADEYAAIKANGAREVVAWSGPYLDGPVPPVAGDACLTWRVGELLGEAYAQGFRGKPT